MSGPIPQGFFETPEDIPNPATGGSDTKVLIVAVGQQHALREELKVGPNLAIFVVTLSPPAYPGYTYIAEMSLAEATTPIVVPWLKYGVSRRSTTPHVHEARSCWAPPEAPTVLWYWPYRTPQAARAIRNDLEEVSYFPMQMVLWRRRVYYEGTPLYLEARWTPMMGETLTIQEWKKDRRKPSLDRMHKGRELLEAIEARGGRPLDTRHYTRDEFHAAYPGAWAEAQKRRGARPKDEDIARALGISLPTIRRYLREYGRPVLP
jgi:hypothetical protein